MSHIIPRRQFFQTSAAVAITRLWSSSTVEAHPESPSHRARLLSGCCAYSYRKYLAGGQMTMEDFILKGVELGVQAVDITTYWLKSTEASYLSSLRHFAFKQGMPFSGVGISTNMCQPDSAKRAEELKKVKDWVDVTDLLGASHLRVFGGELPAGVSVGQGVQWVTELMKPACDYAGKKGITLGIEDHGGITAKASTILEILKRVDSPYAGINLDITNFKEDPYPQIQSCIPYATHTHIRDAFENHEAVDLEGVFKMFAEGGYKGYMSAEYEGSEDAVTGVPKLIGKIKTLCEKYSDRVGTMSTSSRHAGSKIP